MKRAGPSRSYLQEGRTWIVHVKEIEMNAKTEATLAVVAALLVLFSAMWDPRVSAGIAIVALVALAAYRLLHLNR
jgi:hypothetical protein